MPTEYHIDFVFQTAKSSATNLRDWICELTFVSISPDGNDLAKADLKRACQLALEDTKHWYNTEGPITPNPQKSQFQIDNLLGVVISGAIVLDDRDSCAEALGLVGRRLPVLEVADAIKHFGLKNLQCEYDPLKIRKCGKC